MNGKTKTHAATRDTQYLIAGVRAICELMRDNGISRKKAERMLERALDHGYALPTSSVEESERFTRLCDVCARWHLEREFVDGKGIPRPLAWNGKAGNLHKLVSRVVGRKYAREVIEQLISRRLVRRVVGGGWVPKSRVVAPVGNDKAHVARSAAMIGRLLATIFHNVNRRYEGDVLLEVMARVPHLPKREIPSFKRFSKMQGVSFIKTIDDWLESRNLRRTHRTGARTLEAGVVAFAFHQRTAE